MEFTEGALREVAKIARERGTGARGLRAVVEAVLEPMLFDPDLWATYRVTEEAVRGGPIDKLDCFGFPWAPLETPCPVAPLHHRMGRRLAGGS